MINYLIFMQNVNFKIDVISIVFIMIILITMIVGITKGLLTSLISLLASVGAIAIAVIVCNPIGQFLSSSPLGEGLYNSIYNWVASQENGLLVNPISQETKDLILPEAYAQLNIPNFLHDVINSFLEPLIPNEGEVILADLISSSLVNVTMIAASFIVIWLLCYIIFSIILVFTPKVNKVPVLGGLNRLGGAFLGALEGLLICYVICCGMVYLMSSGLDEVSNTLSNWMGLNDDSVWTVSKWMYESNFIIEIIKSLI